jgi:hypothetical protein
MVPLINMNLRNAVAYGAYLLLFCENFGADNAAASGYSDIPAQTVYGKYL